MVRRAGSRKQPPPPAPAETVARRSTWRYGPAAIVVAALAVRAIVLVQLGSHPLLQPTGVLDDAIYVQLAHRVAAGDLALGPDVYFLSPFYTYFLGLVFALTGGSILAARVIQVLLGAAGVALIMATATSWFGKRPGMIAGALAACAGMFAFNEILILQSSIDVFLTSLALFALTRAVRTRAWVGFVAAGLAFGALVLNRPNALPCVGIVALVWIATNRSKEAVFQVAALVLGTSLLLAPVALRNRIVAGDVVLVTSHGGLNFYIGNRAGADGTWKSLEGITPSVAGQARDAQRVASQALGRTVSASGASDYYYGLAWKWIGANPGAWMELMARKLALTINAVDVALNYSYTYFSRDEASLLSVLIIGPWLLIPLGIVGLVVGGPREHRSSYLTWVLFAPVYAVSVAAFFVSSRYRLPLLVPMAIGSGAAVAWFWDRRAAATRSGAFWIAPAAVVLLMVMVNWPLQADDGRMYERGERIVQLMDDGQIDQGAKLLADTEPRYPQRGLLLYRVGLVFRQKGDATRAIAYLERALAADAREPRIHLNLGEALVEAGRAGDAITHLEIARTARIEPATVAYDLAGAYHAVGRDEQARAALASIEVTANMDETGLLELGRSALDLQDPVGAERFLAAAVTRTPTLADAQFYLALTLAQQGRFAEARRHAEEALRLKPDLTEARDLLAKLPPVK